MINNIKLFAIKRRRVKEESRAGKIEKIGADKKKELVDGKKNI